MVDRIFSHLEESMQIPSVQMYQQQLAALYRIDNFERIRLLLIQLCSQGIPLKMLEWNVVLSEPDAPLTLRRVEEFTSKLSLSCVEGDKRVLDCVTDVLLLIIAEQDCWSSSGHAIGKNGARGEVSAADLMGQDSGSELRLSPWCDGLDLFKPKPHNLAVNVVTCESIFQTRVDNRV